MPFVKGKSGNPGGRPKAVLEVIRLARSQTTAVIKRLVDIVKKGDDQAAVAAGRVLLERGWGKPAQEHYHAGLATSANDARGAFPVRVTFVTEDEEKAPH